MNQMRQEIAASAECVRARTSGFAPEVGVILGTGLSRLGDEIERPVRIPYAEIPHFVRSTAESHTGELVCGTLAGRRVVAMKGRFHYYEGWTMREITHPVRVMKALGCTTLIVSNACGGMNPQWRVGDLMVMDDHVNLIGDNPLRGINDPELGPRFPDMSRPYDPALIRLAEEVAAEERIPLRRGVYVAVAGPNLETRAEYRMLRALGADVVGMSTVPEAIVAAHQGTKTLGLSIVTDACLPDALKPACVEEIIKVAGEAEPKLVRLVKGVLRRM